MWVAAKFDCPKRQLAVPRRHRTPISIFEFHSTFHGHSPFNIALQVKDHFTSS